ncbi:MAG: hypothetical protein L0229_09775 [Blastocatellia bacterium]|nr:hypothetical protein [Blastocatellia bacterium]
MSELLTPTKTDQGWAVTMTPEMARAAGVAEGSIIVLYLKEGNVSAEIMPPATEEMKRSVRESIDKFKDAFAEMKRLNRTL